MEDKLLIALIAALSGVLFTFLFQFYWRKRGRFGYSVNQNRIAVSGDDPVHGAIRVTWQGQPATNLYATNILLSNYSGNDYENVVVRVFTTEANLLSERTEVVGTTNLLSYTDEYAESITVGVGGQLMPAQIEKYSRQRDYLIPTFNRGQAIRWSFICSSLDANAIPNVWLDIVHKGVVLKYEIVPNQFWGVSQASASVLGVGASLTTLIILLLIFDQSLLVPVAAFVVGGVAQIPGALILKASRWIRNSFIG